MKESVRVNAKLKLAMAGTVITLGVVGTITAFAATTNTNTSNSGQGARTTWAAHHGRMGHGVDAGAMNLDSIAKLLNLDSSTLKSDLESGKSLAQIAQSQGVSLQTLISTLEINLKTTLDSKVAAGTMTPVQETAMLTNFNSHATQMVESTRRFHSQGGRGPFEHRKAGLRTVAKVLGVSRATLQSDLQSGQSIVDVATSKGISEDSLVATLKANLKSKLDARVSAGKMTSQEEQQMLTNFESRVKPRLERKGGQLLPRQTGRPTKTAGSDAWSMNGNSTSANE